MDIQESVNGKEPTTSAAEGQSNPAGALNRAPLDRLERGQQWVLQAEEEQVEATLNRYAQVARAHLQGGAPKVPDSEETNETDEEREARSQRLKLQQKCQDIAALIMVDELEEEALEE